MFFQLPFLFFYLIDCKCEGGIYESEVENPYSWNRIASQIIYTNKNYGFSYNNDAIYISSIDKNKDRDYFKFDLSSKKFIDIACYREHLAIKQLHDKFEVIECYSQTFKLDSDFADFCYDQEHGLKYLANLLEEIEQYSVDIIEPRYSNAKAYYDKAVALQIIGKNTEAIKCFNEAIKLDTKLRSDRWFCVHIARTLSDLGRYQESIEYYNELIEKPRNWALYLNKGINFHELGMYFEAIECYNEIIKNPNANCHCETYIRKGKSLYNLGRNIEALECYNKATEEDPKNYLWFFNRAKLFNGLGQEAETLKDVNQVYDLLNEGIVNLIAC